MKERNFAQTLNHVKTFSVSIYQLVRVVYSQILIRAMYHYAQC